MCRNSKALVPFLFDLSQEGVISMDVLPQRIFACGHRTIVAPTMKSVSSTGKENVSNVNAQPFLSHSSSTGGLTLNSWSCSYFSDLCERLLKEMYERHPAFAEFRRARMLCMSQQQRCQGMDEAPSAWLWNGKKPSEMAGSDWDDWMRTRELGQNPHTPATAIASDDLAEFQRLHIQADCNVSVGIPQ